jgi:hypothetical protein
MSLILWYTLVRQLKTCLCKASRFLSGLPVMERMRGRPNSAVYPLPNVWLARGLSQIERTSFPSYTYAQLLGHAGVLGGRMGVHVWIRYRNLPKHGWIVPTNNVFLLLISFYLHAAKLFSLASPYLCTDLCKKTSVSQNVCFSSVLHFDRSVDSEQQAAVNFIASVCQTAGLSFLLSDRAEKEASKVSLRRM